MNKEDTEKTMDLVMLCKNQKKEIEQLKKDRDYWVKDRNDLNEMWTHRYNTQVEKQGSLISDEGLKDIEFREYERGLKDGINLQQSPTKEDVITINMGQEYGHFMVLCERDGRPLLLFKDYLEQYYEQEFNNVSEEDIPCKCPNEYWKEDEGGDWYCGVCEEKNKTEYVATYTPKGEERGGFDTEDEAWKWVESMSCGSCKESGMDSCAAEWDVDTREELDKIKDMNDLC